MLHFSYTAIICGGMGPNYWDKEVYVDGPEMTIKEAIEEIEKNLPYDAVIVSIERDD